MSESATADPWRQVPALSGRHVRLEPLQMQHADELGAAACDGELWRLWVTRVPTPDTAADYIAQALAKQAAGTVLPFLVRDRDGVAIGTTRYCNLDPLNQRTEIGFTWYAARAQRTPVNTEAKRLLLGHAFEVMGCVAVELRSHRLNERSRRAIERLGARLDGILRNHMRMPDGTLRDTAVYSIIESEWPTVRAHLDFLLGQTA
ncbi:MAG TPA: GNAT family N-acetyltransferase [Xanthomonadales bacterium]|nr:GNAT family N-acetyltransferase [Xanthomonadales bacterium]